MKRVAIAFAISGLLAVASPRSAAAIDGGDVVAKSEGGAAVYFTMRSGRVRSSCSGVLVAPQKVLTAAHCVRKPSGKDRRVRRVRIGNPKGLTERVRVKSVHVHPDYDSKHPERGHDFAIFVLKTAAKRATPIPMATADDDPSKQGADLVIHGFGLARKGRRLVSSRSTLRSATLEYLSPFACMSGAVKEMAKTRMCASDPDTHVCPGDSGSGAMRTVTNETGDKTEDKTGDRTKTVVVGIVSFVLDSGRCQSGPVVLGRVSAIASWASDIDVP